MEFNLLIVKQHRHLKVPWDLFHKIPAFQDPTVLSYYLQ